MVSLCSQSLTGAVKCTHRIEMLCFLASWTHTALVSESAFVLSVIQCVSKGSDSLIFAYIPTATDLFSGSSDAATWRHLSRYQTTFVSIFQLVFHHAIGHTVFNVS